VAYTAEVIAFAKVNEDMLLDAIPLADITAIEPMQNTVTSQSDTIAPNHSKNSYETTVDFTHAFQIRTRKDGQNAGRQYVLRANSEEEAMVIIDDIKRLAGQAAERAITKSYWGNMRRRLNAVYQSTVFQGVSACMILLVRRNRSIATLEFAN
jgi:hypothetical protein